MKPNRKFFICKHCGNMLGAVRGGAAPVICCGEEMKELVPNTVEASAEKHLPVVTVSGDVITVTVGSVAHPMEGAHHIEFIFVETERGGQRKILKVDEKPSLRFSFADDKPIAAYAYCNLHGLWKTEI